MNGKLNLNKEVIQFPAPKQTDHEIAERLLKELNTCDWRTYVDVRVMQLATVVDREIALLQGLKRTEPMTGAMATTFKILLGYWTDEAKIPPVAEAGVTPPFAPRGDRKLVVISRSKASGHES
jgi:hypothetical protein